MVAEKDQEVALVSKEFNELMDVNKALKESKNALKVELAAVKNEIDAVKERMVYVEEAYRKLQDK